MSTIRLRGIDVPITAGWYGPAYQAGIRHCFAILAGGRTDLSLEVFDFEGDTLYVDSDMWHLAAALLEMSTEDRLHCGWVDLFPRAAMLEVHAPPPAQAMSAAAGSGTISRAVYVLGVADLDADHHHWANAIASLDACFRGTALRSEAMRVLSRLPELARAHFQHEESLMLSTAYPLLAPHRREHVRILAGIYSTLEEFTAGRIQLSEPLIAQLWECENAHVVSADKSYADYLLTGGGRAREK